MTAGTGLHSGAWSGLMPDHRPVRTLPATPPTFETPPLAPDRHHNRPTPPRANPT